MPRPVSNRTVGDLGCDIPVVRREAYHGWRVAVTGATVATPCTIGHGVSPRQGQVAVRVRRDLFHLGLHFPGHPFCGADAAASADHGRSEEHTSELQSPMYL